MIRGLDLWQDLMPECGGGQSSSHLRPSVGGHGRVEEGPGSEKLDTSVCGTTNTLTTRLTLVVSLVREKVVL